MEKKVRKKVEKVECEVVDSKNYLFLKTEYDEIDCLVNNVRSLLNETVENYLKIGYLLSCLDEKLLKKMGYENIYDFSKANFDLGVTSTKNFINVYKRFAITNSDDENLGIASNIYDDITLKEEFEDYSMSQLVELLPVSDSDLDNYNPEMTTKEIRLQKKQSQLTDFELKFYSLVEKRFKEIWSLVILDDEIKCVFNEDTKMLFDKFGRFNFNLVYEKERIEVMLSSDISSNSFWITIETKSNDYHNIGTGFDTIRLNEECDCKAIADKISNFVNEDCKKFILDKIKSKLENSKNNDLNKSISNLITKITEDSKNRTYKLFDFILGDFRDLYVLLDKLNGNSSSGLHLRLNELMGLEAKIPHTQFSSKLFKIEYLSKYSMNLSCPTDSPCLFLLINCTEFDIGIKLQYRGEDGLHETFTLDDALSLYPKHLNEYFKVSETGVSLFSVYYELAKLWVKTINTKSTEEVEEE